MGEIEIEKEKKEWDEKGIKQMNSKKVANSKWREKRAVQRKRPLHERISKYICRRLQSKSNEIKTN